MPSLARGSLGHGFAALRAGRGVCLIGWPAAPSPSFSEAGCGELFAVAAVLDNGALQGHDLLIQQVIGLVDQADERVGYDPGVLVFQPGSIQRPMRAITEIGLIGPVLAHCPHLSGFGSIFGPLGELPLAEEVFNVQEQFVQTSPCDVG